MPLITSNLDAMDTARLQMIEQLKLYIEALEQELRDNRLLMEALEASRLVRETMPEAPQLPDPDDVRPRIIRRALARDLDVAAE